MAATDTTTDQAKAKAHEAAGHAKEQAAQAKDQARNRVSAEVDTRSTQAGEQVRTQASDLRAVGDSLRDQGKEGPAKLAHQAADRAERLGGYLTDADGDRLLADLEDLGRSNPWAVVLGGLAVGFAASRFLKASSAERHTRLTDTRRQIPPSTTPPAVDRAGRSTTL
jgi:hypothetical protein